MTSETPIAYLASILEAAPRVPLMRDWVRVDRVEVLHLIDVIADRTGADGLEQSRTAGSAELVAAVEPVSRAVHRAPRIPFTDQVRLPAGEVERMVDGLRALWVT